MGNKACQKTLEVVGAKGVDANTLGLPQDMPKFLSHSLQKKSLRKRSCAQLVLIVGASTLSLIR